jgi:Na+-transporting methylmalonyl-CoA/oxaloacetate decarboxylase gamma subunit
MEKKPLPAATPNEDKNRLAAAITAAVMKFRKTK